MASCIRRVSYFITYYLSNCTTLECMLQFAKYEKTLVTTESIFCGADAIRTIEIVVNLFFKDDIFVSVLSPLLANLYGVAPNGIYKGVRFKMRLCFVNGCMDKL